jgi:aldehyde dehydrogenase (NAD+)
MRRTAEPPVSAASAGRPETAQVRNLVGGRWYAPPDGAWREIRNPGDLDDVVCRVIDADVRGVREAVAAAAEAQPRWRELGPIRRGEIVMHAARLLRSRRDQFALAITREHGKLLPEAYGEVDRTISVLEFTAGEGRRLGGATRPAEEVRTVAFTRRAPIGVVGLVTPWNFPLAIPAWKVAPALVAGCGAVLKPSPLTPLVSSMLVECLVEAGVPAGVLNLVHGGQEVGAALVADPVVAGVSFTGSVDVGRAIHVACAPRFVRTQLEMGGKNAALVLADADLDVAARAIVAGAFGQAGQRCSATSRVVVDRRVRDRLLDRLVAAADALVVGPADDLGSTIGPVISADRLRACVDGVARAVSEGARVRAGGAPVAHARTRGHFMAPTVLDRVKPHDFIAQEELFGPVLSVLDCDGFDDGIRIVNDVRYGMAAAVFTTDPALVFRAVDDLEAGMVHVNRPGVGAYAHMPHIGTKESQYGPPECSEQVWDFYTEWRTACVTY